MALCNLLQFLIIFELTLLHFSRRLMTDIIKLNVGGQIFHTTKSTLLKYSDTFFSRLFNGKFDAQTDLDGNIFIDRSPDKFRIILEYFRTDQLPTDLSASVMTELVTEFEFYGLDLEPDTSNDITWENISTQSFWVERELPQFHASAVDFAKAKIPDEEIILFYATNSEVLIFTSYSRLVHAQMKDIPVIGRDHTIKQEPRLQFFSYHGEHWIDQTTCQSFKNINAGMVLAFMRFFMIAIFNK
jgi:hypothetical protein